MAQQSSFREFTGGLLRRPGNFAVVQRIKDTVSGLADDLGLPFDLFAARPGEIPDDTGIVRYQYSTIFEYFTSRKSDDTDIGQVQFRTVLYTLSEPSDRVKSYLKGINHLRLHTLFNSGEYDGYMDGFDFISRDKNEETNVVAARDELPATGLGVPTFSTEVYDDDGELVGYSKGYSMDFGVHEEEVTKGDDAPQETWRIRSLNKARNEYEVSPKPNTPARKRAKASKGKIAHINGMPVGSLTSRGTFWLRKEHKSPSRATYQSRNQIIGNTGTPYQAVSKGSKLYKVNETSNGLFFSTVKPRNFNEVAAEEVDPDATQLIETERMMALDKDEPTIFVVLEDESTPWALGKFSNSVTVKIDSETSFMLQNAGGRQ